MMMEQILDSLRPCALFAALDDDALRAFAAQARMQRFGRGQALFHHGDSAAGFFLIHRGRVKVLRVSGDGREQVLHVFGPGEVCGEVPVFQGRDFPATAVATQTTEAIWLPREPFLETARSHPEILLRILAALCERLRLFAVRIEDLSCREVPARLARHLLSMAAACGRTVFDLDGSKAELATALGASAETLSRAFSLLQRREMLRVRGRTMILLEKEALQRLVDGLDG